MSGVAVSSAPWSSTRARVSVSDVAAALLLVLLATAWSGGNLVLAVSGHADDHAHHLEAASAPPEPVGADGALTRAQLDAAVSQAKSDWLAVRPSADLSSVSFDIADLSGLTLGSQSGSNVTIDVDAAGWGWQAMDLSTTGAPRDRTRARARPRGRSDERHPGAGDLPRRRPPVRRAAARAHSADRAACRPGRGDDDRQRRFSRDLRLQLRGRRARPEVQDSTDPSSAGGSEESTVEPMTMPEPVDGTSDSGLDTKGLDVPELSTESLQLADEPMMMTMDFGIASASADGTTGDDVITVVDNGDGTYTVQVGGSNVATVSADGSVSVDGMDGVDVLVGPNLDSVWTITGINSGTLELPNGAKVEFSNVESLTGAATAADEFRFDPKAGLSGIVDDGAGQLTVSVAGFVRVKGNYSFERDGAYQAHVSNGSTVNANLLKVGGTSGEGFVGIEVLGSSIGISGVLTNFTLAVVTAAEQAWHAASGTMSTPTAQLGLGDLELGLDSLTVSVNTESADGTYLNLSANPISSASSTLVLNMASAMTSATAPARLNLGGFLFVSGDITLTLGGPDKVDILTGLEGVSTIPQAIQDIQVAADKLAAAGELRRSEDYTTLWNVSVSSLQFGFTNGTAFVGAGYPGDSDGTITKAEVEAAGGIGLLATGVNLAFVLLTPLGATPLTTRLLGMKGKIGGFELVGLDKFFSLSLTGIEIQANTGGHIVPGQGQAAVVDWVSSFPDPNTSDDPEDPTADDPTPEGYHVFIGGADPPELYLDSTGSTIAFSADRAVLTIGSFLHIGARFSLEQGQTQYLDIEVENLAAPATTQLETAITAVSATDPGGTTLGRNDSTTKIWNLQVKTILIGLTDASLFVGYNPGGFDLADELPLTEDDLDPEALGFLATGLTLGLVAATPVRTAFSAANLLPTFLAVRADLASMKPIGLPDEFVLLFEGIRLEVNRGGLVTGGGHHVTRHGRLGRFLPRRHPGAGRPHRCGRHDRPHRLLRTVAACLGHPRGPRHLRLHLHLRRVRLRGRHPGRRGHRHLGRRRRLHARRRDQRRQRRPGDRPGGRLDRGHRHREHHLEPPGVDHDVRDLQRLGLRRVQPQPAG